MLKEHFNVDFNVDFGLDFGHTKKERKKEKRKRNHYTILPNMATSVLAASVNTPLIQSFRKCTADARHQAGVLSPGERSPKWG